MKPKRLWPHPKSVFWHGLYHFGRGVTYVLFVLLDRPTKKPPATRK